MEAIAFIWSWIIGIIAVLLVILSGPAAVVATVFGVIYMHEDYLWDQEEDRPNGALWRKRNAWKYYTGVIVIGLIGLHLCFLAYYYYPWSHFWLPW